jgi:hypothetical protein
VEQGEEEGLLPTSLIVCEFPEVKSKNVIVLQRRIFFIWWFLYE